MNKDWTVVIPPDVQAQIDADPKLATALAEMLARMKQVLGEVEAGRIDNVDAALTSIGMEKVNPDVLENVTFISVEDDD